jgi:Fasciclin domain
MMRFKKFLLLAVILTIILSGCKKWDDHIAVNNQDLTQDLYTVVKNDPALSRFAELVTQAGLDSLLKSPKTFTVWAPSNTALATLDPSIPNDINKLRSFILNHISYQLYFTKDAQTSIRIGMLNGKYNNFLANKFEDAALTSADKYVRNGVLHVIDKYIPVLPNLWDYINSTTATYRQNSFVAGLNFLTFDPSLAIIDSISATTGLPIYHPGTGIVIKNSFNEKVFDTRREDKQFTYFIIADAGLTLKSDSLKPYFATASPTRTDSLAKWYVVKDLIVENLYPTTASLPAVLISKFGVPIPINTSLIIDSKKVSNGMVYVLSLSGITTASKFQQIIVQGENPSGFQSDKTSNTSYRIRKDRPDTTKTYSDLMVSGHGVTDYYAFYRLNEMPTMKYNVYARAINDFQTQVVFQSVSLFSFVPPAAFTQIPGVPVFIPTAPRSPAQLWYPVPSTRGGVAPLPAIYTFVPPGFAAVSLSSPNGAFTETFLGSFTSNSFGTLDIRLMSGATATLPTLPVFGATGSGPIVLDYLRIVPVP